MGEYMHKTNENHLVFRSKHENHSVPHFNAKIFIKQHGTFKHIGKIEEVFGTVNEVVCIPSILSLHLFWMNNISMYVY